MISTPLAVSSTRVQLRVLLGRVVAILDRDRVMWCHF
jgi:hypothetical protein